MTSRKRQGNRPSRRVAPPEATSSTIRATLKGRLIYSGSANHKLRPSDYGFVPTHNPRPTKSTCDELRPVLIAEARALFEQGIELGMVSQFANGDVPKYVWSVDKSGEVYEAKTKPGQEERYHGYRLGDDDSEMRRYVLDEWSKRCRKN
ncbi:MAG: hypothetical protein H5U13_01830 [Parvibaculum sp.]|nr:hypothetical protein [Parvibaculum sp.]